MDPEADGFRKGLFGCETRSQVAQAALGQSGASGAPDHEFAVSQDFLGEAFATTLERCGDAADVAEVGSDAVNHGALGGRTSGRAFSRQHDPGGRKIIAPGCHDSGQDQAPFKLRLA
jgi:hypothetical protein